MLSRISVSLLRKPYCVCLKSTFASSDIVNSEDCKSINEMPGPKGRYLIPKIGPMFFLKPFGNYTSHTFPQLADSLHDKYGRTFRLELRGKTVITADPESIGNVYRNEGRYPTRGPINLMDHYAKMNKRQRGMVIIDGEEWHRLRSAAQKHLLKANSASIYVEPQMGVASDLITRMSTTTYTPSEFQEELFKYATESIGVVCFNKRLGFLDPTGQSLDTERLQYLEAIHQYFELLLKDVGPPIYKIFPTKQYKDFEKFANVAYGYGYAQLKETLARTQRQMKNGTFNPEEPHLVLKLQASPDTTPDSVIAILLDLLLAGTDSTAKNMELFLLNLALNPDKQQKLYEEILDVIGPKGNEMEAKHMSEMTYFRACMKESFRISFPVSFGSLRILPKDVVIDGYLVPKDTSVFLNCRRACLNSKYFEFPEKYIPERWLRDEGTHKREKDYPAFALLPFGFGTRNCLGRRFAAQELWLGVNKIIQNFQVSVAEKDKNYELIYTTFAQTKDPVSFKFTPR